MTPAILELTTMSISNEFHINSIISKQPDNARITSKNGSSPPVDPNNNPYVYTYISNLYRKR